MGWLEIIFAALLAVDSARALPIEMGLLILGVLCSG